MKLENANRAKELIEYISNIESPINNVAKIQNARSLSESYHSKITIISEGSRVDINLNYAGEISPDDKEVYRQYCFEEVQYMAFRIEKKLRKQLKEYQKELETL